MGVAVGDKTLCHDCAAVKRHLMALDRVDGRVETLVYSLEWTAYRVVAVRGQVHPRVRERIDEVLGRLGVVFRGVTSEADPEVVPGA